MGGVEGQRIVIVGASMGGLRAAEQLRAAGWPGHIEVIGDEAHGPYNRPPLSKEMLTGGELGLEEALASVAFRKKRSIQDVVFRTGCKVVASDLGAKSLRLESGESLSYDGLVIATGIRPKRLQITGPDLGRHVVRTVEDSIGLRRELVPGARVVVIGAGFIGCEAATTAVTNGCTVTLVEGGKGPMHRPMGATVAAAFRKRLARRGITCLPETHAVEYVANGTDPQRVGAVRMSDGQIVEADVVIEAIGSVPNTEWLRGNGLDLDDGVLADQYLRVLDAENAVVVGDVARFPDNRLGVPPRRVEHWSTPGDTAKTAARTLIAQLNRAILPPACEALPNFWSDQLGLRITGLGTPDLADRHEVLEGSLEDIDAGIVVGYFKGSRMVGAVAAGVNAKRTIDLRNELSALPV